MMLGLLCVCVRVHVCMGVGSHTSLEEFSTASDQSSSECVWWHHKSLVSGV